MLFIRWAGSKRALLAHLIPHLPARFGTYWEPFLGSGALFFLLEPDRARLNDRSPELVDLYTAVAQDAEQVAKHAKALTLDKETYYAVRENRSSEPVVRAGEFLFLNRGCFNGLCRVNSDGKFNVPWGAPRSDFIVDEDSAVPWLVASSLELLHNVGGDTTARVNLDAVGSCPGTNGGWVCIGLHVASGGDTANLASCTRPA